MGKIVPMHTGQLTALSGQRLSSADCSRIRLSSGVSRSERDVAHVGIVVPGQVGLFAVGSGQWLGDELFGECLGSSETRNNHQQWC